MTSENAIRDAGPKYLALERTISESEWAVSALPQITKRLQNAEASVKTTRDNIRKFDKRSKDQLERLQNLKHSSVKRAWYRTTGKLEERIEEEEKVWLKEYELVQAAKARAEEQEKEVAEAKKLHDQTVQVKNNYVRAQKDLSVLLDQLFTGPTPSFPSEDEIEQSLVSTRQKLDDINVLAKRQQYVTNSLQRALQCLVGALQALQSSLQLNTYDLFSRGGYADWMVHSALAQARDLAARAQFLISEVRRIDPNVPHLGDIRIEQDNLVFNIIFDNIFTELRVRQIIQDSLVKVERATLGLQNQVLPEVVRKNEAAKAQIEKCQKDVRRLEEAMWNERVRIMHLVVRNAPSQSQAQPTAPEQAQTTFPPLERSPTYRPPEGSAPFPPPVRSPTDASDIASDEPPPPYTARATGQR
jgi:hypothetical protein